MIMKSINSFPAKVVVWEARSGRVVKRLKGHTGTVLGVAFSADSSRLVSGSRDG